MALKCEEDADMEMSKFKMTLSGGWQILGSAAKQLPWYQKRGSEGSHEAVTCQLRV